MLSGLLGWCHWMSSNWKSSLRIPEHRVLELQAHSLHAIWEGNWKKHRPWNWETAGFELGLFYLLSVWLWKYPLTIGTSIFLSISWRWQNLPCRTVLRIRHNVCEVCYNNRCLINGSSDGHVVCSLCYKFRTPTLTETICPGELPHSTPLYTTPCIVRSSSLAEND